MFKTMVAAGVLLVFAGSANAMDFTRHLFPGTNNVDVTMEGEIQDGDAAKLSAFMQGLPGTDRVTYFDLSSPGGNVDEALNIATAIAKSGADTIIHDDAVCASACFWMFSAGKHRWMSNTAQLGVHSLSVKGAETAEGTVWLARFSHKLGIPDSIVVAMINTPADDVTWLSPKQLTEMGVTLKPAARQATATVSPPAPSYAPASAGPPAYAPPAPVPVTPPMPASTELAALREQLSRTTAALDASQAKVKEQQGQIVELGKRLNLALIGQAR